MHLLLMESLPIKFRFGNNDIAMNRHTTLSDVDKLAYLCSSLKDSSAKGIINGLSTSGDFYTEAIETLKAWYNGPRLIHQAHVHMILDAPALKEETGYEIHQLHNMIQQHLRALKTMDYEPSGPFITSILELELDASTNFEWQKSSQDIPGYPHYGKLLDFLDLRAKASEASNNNIKKNLSPIDDCSKRGVNKQITSFAANTSNVSNPSCSLWETEKHSLFTCPQF